MKKFLSLLVCVALTLGSVAQASTADAPPPTGEEERREGGPLTLEEIRSRGLAPEEMSDEEILSALSRSSGGEALDDDGHETWDLWFHPPELVDDPDFVKWDHFRPWFNFCNGPWAGTGHGWEPCKPLEWYPHLDVLYMQDNPDGTLNYGTKRPDYPYFDPNDGSIAYIRNNNTGIIKKYQHIGLFCTPWWGCSNAYGDPLDMWGEWVVDEWPGDGDEETCPIGDFDTAPPNIPEEDLAPMPDPPSDPGISSSDYLDALADWASRASSNARATNEKAKAQTKKSFDQEINDVEICRDGREIVVNGEDFTLSNEYPILEQGGEIFYPTSELVFGHSLDIDI